MPTARGIIESSLRLIGALGTGETPQASDVNDGLETLNDMMDSWSAERLIIPSMTRETFPLVASQSAYTMGSGGDFDTSRPIYIETILVQESASFEIPVKMLNSKQWSQILDKTVTSTLPTRFYVEPNNPLITINLFPVPSAVKTLVINSQKPLTNFSNLSTSETLPPGYTRALKYNLALELAPEYGVQPLPDVYRIARESKANIERNNITPHYLGMDEGLIGMGRGKTFNWLTGES